MTIRGFDENKFDITHPGKTLHRWMLFVDGENLRIRAKEVASQESLV